MDTVSVLITDNVLGKNESCRCAVRCRPSDPNQPSATLALVERQGDFALFLFSNLRQFVVESSDLKLDNILPVASDFACEEAGIRHDSLGRNTWPTDVLLKLGTGYGSVCSMFFFFLFEPQFFFLMPIFKTFLCKKYKNISNRTERPVETTQTEVAKRSKVSIVTA